MKVLRIVLTQNKAHYRKEESLTNKMTYPLPPFSTVIGALHNACGFREYHEMDLSIQGNFTSMVKQPYTDYCFLDSVMDDRGILVKLKNSSLQSTAFEKVASAMKSQNNSFRKNITINIHNENLMNEYRSLKDLNDEIAFFKNNRLKKIKELFKIRKKSASEKKKKFDKNSGEFKKIADRERELKAKEKFIAEKVKEFEHENYTKEISRYESLTTSLKFYEVLHDVKLILHIKSSDETLKKIEDNIYNLKSIGRSEDFVDVKECELVELSEEIAGKYLNKITRDFKSNYGAYINHNLVKSGDIIIMEKEGIPAKGTKYYLNKNYEIKNGKRIFEKKCIMYSSGFKVKKNSKNVYIDDGYIVNFN